MSEKGSVLLTIDNILPLNSSNPETIRANVKPISEGVAIVTKPLVVKTRMDTDRPLVKPATVTKLTFMDTDLERIKTRSNYSGTSHGSRSHIKPISSFTSAIVT